MSSQSFVRILLAGDVMLGRLVDQMFPVHVDDPEHGGIAEHFAIKHPNLMNRIHQMGASFPWGNTLPFFSNADVRIINLETAVTTHPFKDPVEKAFNYRAHPHNIAGALGAASINAACIANNHILDWSVEGMQETRSTLRGMGVAFTGAGNNLEEAWEPAMFSCSCHAPTLGSKTGFVMWGAADHYDYWAASPTKAGINFLDVESFDHIGDGSQPALFLSRIKDGVSERRLKFRLEMQSEVVVVVFSVHWGSNYAWQPTRAQRKFARALIDEAGIDIIHGHSSHHIKGIEIYKGKPILYGCGDFVDDYAVDSAYRNDLGFMYELLLQPGQRNSFMRLELIPTKIKLFQVNHIAEQDLPSDDAKDRVWLEQTMTRLCRDLGTSVDVQHAPYRLLIPIE